MTYKINKEKCVGCGACIVICPEAIIMEDDEKPQVADSKPLNLCGGKDICAYDAIEEISE